MVASRLIGVQSLIAALFFGALQLRAADPQPRVPVLLELFTSEGCSSCPPADKLLAMLDERQPIGGADLVVISEHVDYWNEATWRDPYSHALFTQRQREYAEHSKSAEDVYTPQLVIDGQWPVVGSRQTDITSAIRRSISTAKMPVSLQATRSGDQAQLKLHVDENAQHGKDAVFLVLAADRVQNHVSRGENAGKELSHVAVAYSFEKVATVKAGIPLDRAWSVSLKPKFPIQGATRVIVFVQDPATGHVVGIAQARL